MDRWPPVAASAAGLRSVGDSQLRWSPTGQTGLHLSLFDDFQRVVDLDCEVLTAFKFRMAEQALNDPKISPAAIDQSRLVRRIE